MVVKYEGDEKAAAQFPHGNASADDRPYVRTQPHVLRNVEASASSSAATIYRAMVHDAVDEPLEQQITNVPRNIHQVRNTIQRERNKIRLTHDALYNLHEFAYDSNFVHHVVTVPDLTVLLYDPATLSLFRSLLSSDSSRSLKVCTRTRLYSDIGPV